MAFCWNFQSQEKKGYKIIIKISIPENLIPNPPVHFRHHVLSLISMYSYLILLVYILICKNIFTYHYIQTSYANKQSDFGHENVTLCMLGKTVIMLTSVAKRRID